MPQRRPADHHHLTVEPLRRGGGPEHSWNAKTGVGLTSVDPWGHAVTAPAGSHWHATITGTGLEGRTVGAGDALRVATFGVFDADEKDVRDAYASTAVSVDVLFTDGTRLSESGAADQYGIPLDAAAQYAAKTAWPDQWASRTVPLAAVKGKTIQQVELTGWLPPRIDSSPGGERTSRGFVDRIEIVPADVRSDDAEPIDHVKTTRGTFSSGAFSRGNCAPLVSRPHGFVFGLPMTDAGNRCWPYSYQQGSVVDGTRVRPYLQAFGTSHIPSPWMGDRGVFQVFPHPDPAPHPHREHRALPFSHDTEIDRPHVYEATLGDMDPIHAELSAADHSLWLRATYSGATGSLIFDQIDDDGRLDLPEPTAGERYVATGYVDGPGSGIKIPRTYVYVEVDGAVTAVQRYPGHHREHVVGVLTLDPAATGGTVTVAVGVSHISLEQARRNLAEDRTGDFASSGAFADVVDRGRGQWSGMLGRLTVEGATPEQLTTLYSCLHRVHLYPNHASEDDRFASVFDVGIEGPDTPEKTGRRVVDGNLTVTDGFWDSYRASWPLRTLIAPELTGRLLEGFVEHYRDGGWVSRWSAPGPCDIMTGTSSDAVFADAAVGGLWDGDEHLLLDAYDSCLRNATTPSDDKRVGRKDQDQSLFTGFASTAVPEGMSWTVDAAINDAAIAEFSRYLAQHLPRHERAGEFAANADWFAARAARYAVVFDPETGFFRGRRPDGAWRPGAFDPRNWGGDYTETNAYGTRFTVPHDGQGLAELYGGRDVLEARLDEFMGIQETARYEFKGGYANVIHEMTEARDARMGMLALSNQPAHHIPFMYAYASRPGSTAHAKTQAIVREATARLFAGADLGQGYPGDEDNGEMSAWYLLAVSGLYPLSVGSGRFVLCAPTFPRLTWRLENGATIDVVAPKASPENVYIQSVSIDGKPWNEITVDRERLWKGAVIHIDLGPEPSEWAAGSVPPSFTPVGAKPAPPVDLTSPNGARKQALGVRGAGHAFDDSSSSRPAVVKAGGELGWDFGTPTAVDHYTVTVAEPGHRSWRLQARGADGTWSTIDDRSADFRWDHQTRIFAIDGVSADAYRLVFTTAAAVDQLEFLHLGR
ncbi:MAG: GH92 family glycosyl hydrolase [Gordonia sp. (in: high G+C Gram-positive bacteria)]|uniref:GH92 family glycosyl hydrolase n=1 Tax=Gordonia sp. (in: high G+C Gram-positive bacteria) TaxID=84139 RepID=UPI0039E6DBFB